MNASGAGQAVQWRVEDGGNGHWYRWFPRVSGRNWHGWKSHAESLGGHLASITSEAENAFVTGPSVFPGAFADVTGTSAFFGAFQPAGSPEPQADWQWVTAEPFVLDPVSWRSLEDCCGGSYCSGDGEDAAALWTWAGDPADPSTVGKWNDVGKCLDTWGAVVEWSADCNGDGVVDLGQILAGTFADSDGNGVPDACEWGSGLIHSYDFAVGVEDLVGDAHGTLVNGASIASGALLTDGVDDFVQFPGRIIPSSGPFTVALRFRTLSVPPGWMELISQGCSGCGSFYLGRALNGQWRYWLDNASVQTGVPFPADGAWHHVAATYEPGGLTKLYVDGSFVREFPAAPLANTGAPTRLACQFDQAEHHHGYIDDVRIYDVALSASAVAMIASTCVADIVVDGVVNGADLGLLLSQWGPATASTSGDLDANGTVDGADLSIVLATWGPCP